MWDKIIRDDDSVRLTIEVLEDGVTSTHILRLFLNSLEGLGYSFSEDVREELYTYTDLA